MYPPIGNCVKRGCRNNSTCAIRFPATTLQTNSSLQPMFSANAFGSGTAGVVFNGIDALLTNAAASVGSASTMFAVFRDDGSSGGTDGPCCSGVVFFQVRSCERAMKRAKFLMLRLFALAMSCTNRNRSTVLPLFPLLPLMMT